MKSLKQFVGIILFSLLAMQANATKYYVAKNGSDSNDGSEATPFLTISKAAAVMVAGDTCVVKVGVYRELVNPVAEGKPGTPIVFMNYPGDSVVVAATEPVTTWEQYQGNVYRAGITMPLGWHNMVFCGNKPMDPARWPNNEDGDPFTVEAAKVSGGTGSSLVSETAIPAVNWSGGYVWYLGAHSGTSWTREITSQQGTEVQFTPVDITKWPFSSHNPTVFRNNNYGQYYLFGVLGALDYEREWYYDDVKDSLYFQAPGNADPSTLNVEVVMREHTINIAGDYIVFDGIDAFGGKVQISGANCTIKNGYFLNCLEIPDNLDNTGAQVFTAALHVGGANAIVEYNTVDGSSINGIYVQGWGGVENVILRHNYILNCNTVGIHARPINAGGSKHKFLSNTIKTAGRDGIYTSGTDIEIAYNDISGCMMINNDGGVYYTVGNANLKNIEVHHNWFHDSYGPEYADGRAAGVYLDNNSKGYLVHHNVIWNITWTGLQVNWNNTYINFYNNTLVNCGAPTGRWANGYTESNNRVWNSYATAGTWATDDFKPEEMMNLIAADELEDLANLNFIPKLGSLLVDGGTAIAGITDNAVSNAPDIGAYERGLTPWIPGVNTEYGDEVDPNVEILPPAITGIDDEQLVPDYVIYPNPAQHGSVNIRIENISDKAEVSIFNPNGKLVYQAALHESQLTIPGSVFNSAGMYFAHIRDEKQKVVKKIIVH